MKTYELWDGGTGNQIGLYESEREALRDVARDVEEYGASSYATVGLLERHGDLDGQLLAEGDALVARAKAAFPTGIGV
jgi:hypothetical protein